MCKTFCMLCRGPDLTKLFCQLYVNRGGIGIVADGRFLPTIFIIYGTDQIIKGDSSARGLFFLVTDQIIKGVSSARVRSGG